MQIAKAFVKDMRAFHAEPNAIKRDGIAARQAWILDDYRSPGKKWKLRREEMFERMKDQA